MSKFAIILNVHDEGWDSPVTAEDVESLIENAVGDSWSFPSVDIAIMVEPTEDAQA